MTWYTWQDGAQQGPFEEQQVRDLALAGSLGPLALVWREGAPGWSPLAELLAPAAPTAVTRPCARCLNRYPENLLAPWGGVEVCAYCKPRHLAELRESAAFLSGHTSYASWGTRFAARMIDGVILSIVNVLIQVPMLVSAGLTAKPGEFENGRFLFIYAATVLTQLAVQGFYEIWFVYRKGATPGKLILELQIVDGEGKRLSKGRATGRYFAQYISGLTLGIGYLLPLWDPEKRTLHDMIADTRVVKK